MADRSDLFDVLDADNSGAIDISELIAGLMKLRNGGACAGRRRPGWGSVWPRERTRVAVKRCGRRSAQGSQERGAPLIVSLGP